MWSCAAKPPPTSPIVGAVRYRIVLVATDSGSVHVDILPALKRPGFSGAFFGDQKSADSG